MRCIIQPARPPPDPQNITGLSQDAAVVWKHLQAVAQKNTNKQRQSDGDYYQKMYKRKFGVIPGQCSNQANGDPACPRPPAGQYFTSTQSNTLQGLTSTIQDGSTPAPLHSRITSGHEPHDLTRNTTTPSPAPRWLNSPTSNPHHGLPDVTPPVLVPGEFPSESPLRNLANQYNKTAWSTTMNRTLFDQIPIQTPDNDGNVSTDERNRRNIYLPNLHKRVITSKLDFPPEHTSSFSSRENRREPLQHQSMDPVTSQSIGSYPQQHVSGEEGQANLLQLRQPNQGLKNCVMEAGKYSNMNRDIKAGRHTSHGVLVNQETPITKGMSASFSHEHQHMTTSGAESQGSRDNWQTKSQRRLFDESYQLVSVNSQVPLTDITEIVCGSQDLFDTTQLSVEEMQRSKYFCLSGDSPPLDLTDDSRVQELPRAGTDSIMEKPTSGIINVDVEHAATPNGRPECMWINKEAVQASCIYENENTDGNGSFTHNSLVNEQCVHDEKLVTPTDSEGQNIHTPSSSISRRLREMQKEEKLVAARKRKSSRDTELQTVEDFLNNDEDGRCPLRQSKKCRKPSFKVPTKTTGQPQDATAGLSNSSCSLLQRVEVLSKQARDIVASQILASDEVAVTLVYCDGSSQLSPSKEQKRKISTINLSPSGIGLVYTGAPKLDGQPGHQFAFIAFVDCLQQWTRTLVETLMESKRCKVCYGAQELIKILILMFNFSHKSVVQQWLLQDPQVAAWLLDPDHTPAALQDIISPYTNLRQKEEDDRGQQLCCDLDLLLASMKRLRQQLVSNHLWTLFMDLEMHLSPILALMELRGICVNKRDFVHATELLKRKIRKLETTAHQAAGRQFTLSSHVQLRQVIFDELKLDQRLSGNTKIARTSVKNQKSTSEAVLLQLSTTHPLPDIVLQHRQLVKLKSTYMDGMIGHVKDDMLHTHWDQTAAATGRLTSTNPNIQAIPKQPVTINIASIQPTQYVPENGVNDDEEEEIYARSPFVSQEGYTLLAADFQQIELRILAHLADDTHLINIFNDPNCNDIFIELTSQWLCKDAENVSSSEREQTKRIVYSVMYGAGKDRLAEYLRIPPDEAKNIMHSFLVKFPAVSTFTKSCIDQARQKGMEDGVCPEYPNNNETCKLEGYHCTILRRRRLFPHIKSPNPQLRAYSERQAVNFCVQGSAADLCKAAMIQVEHALQSHDLDARLLVQIHDELLLEVRDQHITQTANLVKSIMESAEGLCGPNVVLKVPLKVSLSTGKSWAHLQNFSQ